jgi:hypothetical protein
MIRSGLRQSEIARVLRISRQGVNRIAEVIPERVEAALTDAAQVNSVEPRFVDVDRGVLFGWNRDFQTETAIMIGKKGLQVWHQHNLGNCKICPDQKRCKADLVQTADDLGIPLTRAERILEPSELSNLIFSRFKGRNV